MGKSLIHFVLLNDERGGSTRRPLSEQCPGRSLPVVAGTVGLDL